MDTEDEKNTHLQHIKNLEARNEALTRELTDTCLLFQAVLDTLPVRVFWKDRDCIYQGANHLFVSDANCESVSDLVGKTDYDLPWRETQADTFTCDDQAVMGAGIHRVNYEEPQARAEGKEGWLRTSKVPLKNHKGEIIGVLGTYEDITEQKHQEIALAASEARLKALFNQTFQFTGLLDPRGNLLLVNAAVTNAFGPMDDYIGLPFEQSPPWQNNHKAKAALQRGITQAQNGVFSRFRSSHKLKNGDNVDIDFSIKPVFNDQGEVEYLLPEGRDITELLLFEEERFKTTQWLNAAFEHTPLAVIQWTEDHCVSAWNDSAQRIFGYPVEEALGKHASFIIERELQPLVDGIFQKLFKQEGGTRSTNQNITKDNHRILCNWYNTPIKDKNGGVSSVVSFIEDITERVKRREALEQSVYERTEQLESTNKRLRATLDELELTHEELIQREKMASLGSLVSGVAHEVNTPIGVGITAASHLSRSLEDIQLRFQENTMKKSDLERFFEVASESSSLVQKNLTRASDLIASFKTVAVEQSSEQTGRIKLVSYINDVILSLTPHLKNTGVKLELDCPEDISLETYPGHLAQIITNLTMNSLVHAFDGGLFGRITLKCEQLENMVRMTFTDNGRGMSEEVRKHVFDPFFTTRRGSGGSGLGLNIVYNIVTQKLGGKIDCQSRPEQGATFIIDLPVTPHTGE